MSNNIVEPADEFRAAQYANIYEPTAAKYLLANGEITDVVPTVGLEIDPPDPIRAMAYKHSMPQAAKWLLPDGSIVDALPTSGGGGGDYATTAQLNAEIAAREAADDLKLDKVTAATSYPQVYGKNANGSQYMSSLSGTNILNGGIAVRNSSGQIIVPTTPSADNNAVSKSYVDNTFIAETDLSTSQALTKNENDLITGMSYSRTATANSLVQRYSSGAIAAAPGTAPTLVVTKSQLDNAITSSYIGAYWYARESSETAWPTPTTNEDQNGIDLSDNTIWTWNGTTWAQGAVITPQTGSQVGVSKEFIDGGEDMVGFTGFVKWNGTGWDIYPSRFEHPDGVTISYDANGDLQVVPNQFVPIMGNPTMNSFIFKRADGSFGLNAMSATPASGVAVLRDLNGGQINLPTTDPGDNQAISKSYADANYIQQFDDVLTTTAVITQMVDRTYSRLIIGQNSISANTVAVRNSTGNVRGATATNNQDLVPLKQMNDALAAATSASVEFDINAIPGIWPDYQTPITLPQDGTPTAIIPNTQLTLKAGKYLILGKATLEASIGSNLQYVNITWHFGEAEFLVEGEKSMMGYQFNFGVLGTVTITDDNPVFSSDYSLKAEYGGNMELWPPSASGSPNPLIISQKLLLIPVS
jgi:hypothetical protein